MIQQYIISFFSTILTSLSLAVVIIKTRIYTHNQVKIWHANVHHIMQKHISKNQINNLFWGKSYPILGCVAIDNILVRKSSQESLLKKSFTFWKMFHNIFLSRSHAHMKFFIGYFLFCFSFFFISPIAFSQFQKLFYNQDFHYFPTYQYQNFCNTSFWRLKFDLLEKVSTARDFKPSTVLYFQVI